MRADRHTMSFAWLLRAGRTLLPTGIPVPDEGNSRDGHEAASSQHCRYHGAGNPA
jgi:hypothetical protein